MSTPIIDTITKEETSDTIDVSDLENFTDDELLKTLKKLEQEKELLAQQQLLKEINKLQNEIKIHEKQKKRVLSDEPISETDLTNQELIDDLTIDELSERLEELKIQRDDFSNKKLLEEIEALQNDIQRLQTDTDYRETRIIARNAVAVYALSPTEIEVRWDSLQFGEVESYTVFHKPVTGDDNVYVSIPLNGTVASCIISELEGNTTYHIRMEAEGSDKSEIKTDTVEVTTFKSVSGFVLILANYQDFQLKALSNIEGTLEHVESLKSTFENLHFEVKLEENLTGAKMIESIQSHRQWLDQIGIDCFILVLASYKYHGYIFGIDGGVLISRLIDCLKYDSNTDSTDAQGKQRIVLIDTAKIKEETIQELDDSNQPRNVKVRYIDSTNVEFSFQPPKLSELQVSRFVVALNDEKFAAYPDHNGQAVNGIIKTSNKESNCPVAFGLELISQSQIYAFWKPSSIDNSDNIFYHISHKSMDQEEFEGTTVSYPCHVFDNLKQNTMYTIKISSVKRDKNNFEYSDPAEVSITTPKDGTPIIMADSSTTHILGEPHFMIATANGPFVSEESPSFLGCFAKHLLKKHNRFNITSIIQDVRNELVYTSDRYEMPILSSTLNKTLFLGGSPKMKLAEPDNDKQDEGN
ncbi:unnamed protein product [Mytilus coruscus]|uniref:Fibronectin type-III domain-containing protein n=1 Tax=Mytilus coruscus TaxID=42192 RepID=A0A6J8BJ75_MYTCO|nr:unnamed protein product [Mytilus coruscus]